MKCKMVWGNRQNTNDHKTSDKHLKDVDFDDVIVGTGHPDLKDPYDDTNTS